MIHSFWKNWVSSRKREVAPVFYPIKGILCTIDIKTFFKKTKLSLMRTVEIITSNKRISQNISIYEKIPLRPPNQLENSNSKLGINPTMKSKTPNSKLNNNSTIIRPPHLSYGTIYTYLLRILRQ